MSIVEFLSQPVWQRLGLTLVHFLWQGLAVAVLVGVLVRVFRLKHGNARYGAYLLAFIAMIACPVVTFTAIDIPISPNTELVTGAESAEVVETFSYAALPAGDILPEAETSSPAIPTLADSIPLGQRISDWLNVSMPWILVIWMLGVIVLSVRLLMGFVGVYRWRHHLEPLPERLVQRIASLSEGLGMRGFSRVFISPTVLQAMAVGYLRPMVLLPAAMVTQMQPEMLEAVIAHELAHIRRFDLWINLAQRVAETLLFYHPAVWWLSICLRSERELCCDELAVKATGRRLTYATTLESVGRARFMAKQPILAAGLGQDNKPTLSRVRHILGLTPTQRNCPFWLAGVITVLFLAALVIPTTLALTNQSDEKLNDLESVVVEGIGANRNKFECGYLAWSSKQITTRFADSNRPATNLAGQYELWWDGNKKMTTKYVRDMVHTDPEEGRYWVEKQQGGNSYDGSRLSIKPRFDGSENWLGPGVTRWRGRGSRDWMILIESNMKNIRKDWSVIDANGAKLIRCMSKNMNETARGYGGYSIRDYDPSKGYGLVNEESYNPNGNQRLKHTVKMFEVIPGGWFPVEVDSKSFAITDGKVYSHNHYALDIERCSFNDKSALPDRIFKSAIDKQLKYQEKLQKYLAMELRGISDVKGAAEADKVKLGAREAIEKFVAAAMAGDFEKARQFADPDKAPYDQVTDIPELAGGQNLWIMAVVADDFSAIAVSSVILGDHERIGPLVFFLDRKPQDGRDNWWVDDIDMETPDSAEVELKRFLEKHPKAQKVPYENKPDVPVEEKVEFELITSPLTIKGIELQLSKVATLQYWNEVFDLDSETISNYEPGTWRWPKGTDIGFDIDMPQEIRDSVSWGINDGYETTGHRFLALDSYSFEQAVRETSAKLDELRNSKWMGFGLSKLTLPKFPEFFAVLTDGYSVKADSTVEHPSPKLAIIEVVEARDKSAEIKYWLERKTQNKPVVQVEVQEKKDQKELSKFKTTLPNGVTVELLCLYYGKDIKDSKFWKPDGSLMSNLESQEYREKVIFPKWSSKDFKFEYGLMVRFNPLDSLSTDVFVKQGQRMTYNYPKSEGIAVALVASDRSDRKAGFSRVGTIKAAAATGPWKTHKSSARINEPSVRYLDDRSKIMLSPPRKTDEWLLDVTVNSDSIDLDCFYELKEGSIHHARSSGTIGHPDWIGPEQRTPMSIKQYSLFHEPEQIKNYIIKYRKFEIIEFKNISLQPGIKPAVQVEGETPDEKIPLVWGEAVEGVQMRVRPERQRWYEGETPKFIVDMRNKGMVELELVLAQEAWEVELDGLWYRAGAMYTGDVPIMPLGPREEQNDILFYPGVWSSWNINGKPLKFTPGLHTVRLSFGPSTRDRAYWRLLRVVSNPVLIEILPAEADKRDWGEAVAGLQCGLRADKRVWRADETPKLQAVARNVGRGPWRLPRPSELFYLKVGSKIWRWKGPDPGEPVELKPGEVLDKTTILLSEDWVGAYGSDLRLKLSPGKHTIQLVMFVSDPVPPEATPGTIPIPRQLRIESNVVAIEVLPKGERPGTVDDEGDAATNLQAELHELWRQRDQGLAGAEAFGKRLLEKYTEREEKSLVYYQLAEIYAQSGQADPNKIVEFAREGWWHLQDPVKKARLFVYWGDALQLTKGREEAARIYLRGLRFCLQFGLPKDKPERPMVGAYTVDGRPEVVKEYRRGNQLEMAAWKHATRIEELIELRQALTGQIVGLYAQEPDAFDELHALSMKYLGSGQAAQQLIAVAKAYRTNPEVAIPVITSIGGDPNPKAGLDWGEETKGIRVRLRADTKSWGVGDVPKFKLDVRNDGSHILMLTSAPDCWGIEVDGIWYKAEIPMLGGAKGMSFGPDKRWYNLELSLDMALGRRSENASVGLEQGRHTIRAALSAGLSEDRAIVPVGAVSDPVEIQIEN